MRVRHVLSQAGFHLAGEADSDAPGLRVSEAPGGVLVRWAASDGFSALASERAGGSGDSMRAIVQAAVSGLLLQLGHTVSQSPGGGGLLVLAEDARTSRTGGARS